MKVVNLLYITLVALCLTACSNFKNISIDDIQQGKVRTQSGTKVTVEIKVKVNNPTGHNLVLRKIKAEVLRNGYQFADVRLKKKVKVPPHTNNYHSVFIEFDLIDVMAVITGTVDLTQLDDSFTTTGFIKGGTGLFCKKYKFTDVPMSQLQGMMYTEDETDDDNLQDAE